MFVVLKAKSRIFLPKVVALEDGSDKDSLLKVSQATIDEYILDTGYVNIPTTASFTLTFRSGHNLLRGIMVNLTNYDRPNPQNSHF